MLVARDVLWATSMNHPSVSATPWLTAVVLAATPGCASPWIESNDHDVQLTRTYSSCGTVEPTWIPEVGWLCPFGEPYREPESSPERDAPPACAEPPVATTQRWAIEYDDGDLAITDDQSGAELWGHVEGDGADLEGWGAGMAWDHREQTAWDLHLDDGSPVTGTLTIGFAPPFAFDVYLHAGCEISFDVAEAAP